jgi:hypothetical protein
MSKDKVEVKVVEVEANKLVPGAKYIFTINPSIDDDFLSAIQGSLEQLIGADNFVLLPLESDELRVFSVVPEEKIGMIMPDISPVIVDNNNKEG